MKAELSCRVAKVMKFIREDLSIGEQYQFANRIEPMDKLESCSLEDQMIVLNAEVKYAQEAQQEIKERLKKERQEK
jgi:hypothetical protein